jgi:hypothetical protein
MSDTDDVMTKKIHAILNEYRYIDKEGDNVYDPIIELIIKKLIMTLKMRNVVDTDIINNLDDLVYNCIKSPFFNKVNDLNTVVKRVVDAFLRPAPIYSKQNSIWKYSEPKGGWKKKRTKKRKNIKKYNTKNKICREKKKDR